MQPLMCRDDEPDWHVVTQVLVSDGTNLNVTFPWLGDDENLCELFRDCYHDGAKNVYHVVFVAVEIINLVFQLGHQPRLLHPSHDHLNQVFVV